jgi:hypothetical protein
VAIRPTRIPKIRDRMAALLTDPHSPLRRTFSDDTTGLNLDITARHLTTGALYWVSSDMTALATAAGRELDTVRWTTADRPTGTGLIVMDGGVGWMPYQGVDFPVDAISWGPGPGGLLLCMWVARHRLDARLADQGGHLDPDEIPQLVPMLGEILPNTADFAPVDTIPDTIRTVATTLAAAWYLMEQPTLATQQRTPADRDVRRAYLRNQRPEPDITLIDLRTLYRPHDHEPEEQPGRYSHRWVVTGHWRNQAHGPERSQRKRIWIPDYVKGPDSAPLLIHERINVWRR